MFTAIILALNRRRPRYAIRWCGERLLNLDSELRSPEVFGSVSEAQAHVQAAVNHGGDVFVVKK